MSVIRFFSGRRALSPSKDTHTTSSVSWTTIRYLACLAIVFKWTLLFARPNKPTDGRFVATIPEIVELTLEVNFRVKRN